MLFKYFAYLLLLLFFLQKHWQGLQSRCYMGLTVADKFKDVKSNNSRVKVNKYIPARIKGREQKIPYYIFNTYEEDKIPWKLSYSVNSLLEKNPQYAYRYFNDTERRDFLGKYYGKVYVDCYDKVYAKAYRADIFRYALIYMIGGCYVDIPFIFTDSISSVIEQNTTYFSTVDDLPEDFVINSAFFCSTAGHPIVKLVLQKAIKVIATSSYETSPLDITGPKRHAAAYKQHFHIQQILPGYFNNSQTILLDRLFQFKCLKYQYPKQNGDIIAIHRYPDFNADRSQSGDNQHYSQKWFQHRIYNQSIKVQYHLQSFHVPQHQNFISSINIFNDIIIPS